MQVQTGDNATESAEIGATTTTVKIDSSESQQTTALPEISNPNGQADLRQQVMLVRAMIVIGVLLIIASFAYALTGIFALPVPSVENFAVSYVWGNALFSALNGAVALRAAFLKPRINLQWITVVLAFSVAALTKCVLDNILEVIYAIKFLFQSRYAEIMSIEVVMLVMYLLVLLLEVGLVAVANALRRRLSLSSAPVTYQRTYQRFQ